ncbi:hypothetical protein FJW05_22135 [Mesorhizobium sp. B2-9-1]|uniref:hypothetical protein n=1 Tax=Mesorhizobium sp. B2-9-1 TaxID=2589898 RepID=UPI00112A6909|nr:hypothetical protein [Mesorhizobium sp. B2-9-1]TPI44067.1 hypothetical protein FJW05_22135 [Mesorhizobium sp. B2-9-1]
MSDNYLHMVPDDPYWRPDRTAAEKAANLVRGLFPQAEHVGIEYKEAVTFFDAGANTESVYCAFCGSELEDWWGNAMDQAAVSDFSDLAIVTPCCSKSTSLNDLRYVWPAAFGMCSLTVVNPGATTLCAEERRRIEQAIGSPLKVIWQHL